MKRYFKYILFSIILFSFSTIVKAETLEFNYSTVSVYNGSNLLSKKKSSFNSNYYGFQAWYANVGTGTGTNKIIYNYDSVYGVYPGTIRGDFFGQFDVSKITMSNDSITCSFAITNTYQENYIDYNHYAFTCDVKNYTDFINFSIYYNTAIYSDGVDHYQYMSRYVSYDIDANYAKLNDIQTSVDNANNNLKDTNDTMKDDNIDTSSSSSFFNNFKSSDHGLSGVINAPLKFIQSLSNNTCSNVSLTIPFVDETFNLPCFSTIYKENFNTVYTIYQVVITALVGYWVCVKIYAMVKGFKDPTNDRIEVMDL